MRHPPTDRQRAIARLRKEGATIRQVAEEFSLSPERIRQIVLLVNDYDHGASMFRSDPGSIEALYLVGKITALTRHSLESQGVCHLTQLEGLTLRDLLRWPGMGRQTAMTVIELWAEFKRPR